MGVKSHHGVSGTRTDGLYLCRFCLRFAMSNRVVCVCMKTLFLMILKTCLDGELSSPVSVVERERKTSDRPLTDGRDHAWRGPPRARTPAGKAPAHVICPLGPSRGHHAA